MSIDYTIKAYPTMYRGRQYRSRLEARWAAFFDHLGIRHEYEPYDIGGWSPDFLLPDWRVLVEVKPITEFSEHTWNKAVKACGDRGLFEETEHHLALGGIFLTSLAPVIKNNIVHAGWFGCPNVGKDSFVANDATVIWIPEHSRPNIQAEIAHASDEMWFCASGNADLWFPHDPECPQPYFYTKYTMELWAAATNAVQYRPADES